MRSDLALRQRRADIGETLLTGADEPEHAGEIGELDHLGGVVGTQHAETFAAPRPERKKSHVHLKGKLTSPPMRSLRYLHLDVFTERPLEGNQLAVFMDGAGVDPTRVDLDWTGDRLAFAWMYQQRPTFGDPISDVSGLAGALGLHPSSMLSGLPVQVVSCGLPFLMVPIATADAVDSAEVD